MDDDSEHKKAKGTNKWVIKRGLLVKNYKDCLFNDKSILKLQETFKSDCHNVYTEQINKIELSSNDDKRLQTFDKITTYPYQTNAFKSSNINEVIRELISDFFLQKDFTLKKSTKSTKCK